MSQYHEYLHQKARLIDYRDQISSGLFQIHRILTSYFPEIDAITLGKLRDTLENEMSQIISKLDNHIEV